MSKSILIESTDSTGKKLQKVITNINPDATDYQLKMFSQKINALTTNEYKGTVRVDRDDITNAENPRSPHFSITPATYSEFDLSEKDQPKSISFTLDYLGDNRTVSWSGYLPIAGVQISISNRTLTLTHTSTGMLTGGNETCDLLLTVAATDDYDEETITLTATDAYHEEFKEVSGNG